MQCQEAKCMAWKPELKLELKGIHSVPNEIQELFKQMSGQGLRMEGTMLVIDAHCVLLESKK
jgi:hypothetical protein